MSDWTASEAREFLSIIREEAERAAKNFGDKQSSVYACLAVVTDVSESGSISVRLLSSPSDGSQDFVVRNRSGSTLEVGDSVWLHYWSDYTNVYIAVRNMGDTEADITATGIGALSYAEAQTLTMEQKIQVLSNAGAEASRLQFINTSVANTAFVSDATYTDYPYRASVALAGVLSNMVPHVVFGAVDAKSGKFAPVAACYNGGVYLYASSVPAANITIPTIICWR